MSEYKQQCSVIYKCDAAEDLKLYGSKQDSARIT